MCIKRKQSQSDELNYHLSINCDTSMIRRKTINDWLEKFINESMNSG
jgi:hypothetical protein